ncbi:acyl-CoA dehydrogenase family protein [Bacteroidota bacterium]
MEEKKLMRGGEFLLRETKAEDVFIPEEFDEEQLMIAQTCEDFLEAEVFPHLDSIDAQEKGLMPSILKKSGELGLLGISIPMEYEGFDQSFVTSMRANEAIGSANSFSVAFMAHTGIGTLPLLYYGNDEQKQKYIPQLASGELLAAYCLTEPGAGSDANSGKSKAVLSEDGRNYILNGQKMWITNGGFADLLTVFAKIDNDRVLSAFLVEANWEGITINPEEKKMGIKGSSTTQIFFNDVKVPVENLLGKRGEGFRIALNILHIGRIKLGGTVLGACKKGINQSVNYANERKQFGTQISSFGAIKHKLAEQVIKTWVAESAVYRSSGDVNQIILKLLNEDKGKGEANIGGIAEFAIEAALMKVFGSEALDYVVDEAVQIFGGMGYSAEAPIDRGYRDSRINRIFEGTNEINRLLAVDTTLKKAPKGDFPLFEKAREVLNKLDSYDGIAIEGSYYELLSTYVQNFKDAVLMTIALANERFDKDLVREQEVLMNISDMMMDLYAVESTMLRVQKLESLKGESNVSLYKDILSVFMYDAATRIYKAGKDAINSMFEGEKSQDYMKALHAMTSVHGVNTKEARRRLADKLIDDNCYKF